MATDKQFSTLERLYILTTDYNLNRSLIFPETFQAPHLRYLVLWGAVPAVGFTFTTVMNLVTLGLYNIPPFAYFTPSSLFTRLSLMPQLESLAIAFDAHVVNREFNNQLSNTPIMSQIALPNLRWFWFRGFSTYLDDVFAQISAPLLKTLSINLFAQFTPLAVPHFLQFVSSSENLGFRTVLLGLEAMSFFSRGYQHGEHGKGSVSSFEIWFASEYCCWPVASVMQALGALLPLFSVAEQLTLSCRSHDRSLPMHNDLGRTQWRGLLRLFSSVNTRYVVARVSCSLQSEGGEPPLELSPNLELLGYSAGGDNDYAAYAFISFINKRQRAGCAITLSKVDDSLFGCESPWS